MSIKPFVQKYAVCDFCTRYNLPEDSLQAPTVRELRVLMNEDGWTRRGKLDACFNCTFNQ